MKNSRRVTWEDRLQIKAFLDSGVLPTVIADKLDFDKSTICREFQPTAARGVSIRIRRNHL